MKELVMDASVIIKWLSKVDEAHVEEAVKLKADAFDKKKYELIVPTYWIYEIGNVIMYKIKIPEQQDEALSLVLNLQIQAFQFTDKQHQEILKLARIHRTTYYDTSYHYLSKIRDCEMITADEKFILAVKDPRVRHLKEYPF